MKTFYFVAGEQLMTIRSITVLDAWMKLVQQSKHRPVANEFRKLPIEALDHSGTRIAIRTWGEWDSEVLRDTYGNNYREHLDHAASLIR